MLGYKGRMKSFPEAVMGSAETLDLRDDMCLKCYGGLELFGYGYGRKFGNSGAGMKGRKEGSKKIWGDK